MNPELSVVVVLHNSASALRECLRSLGIAAERARVEVIAVDNASPDESADIVQSEMPGATVIEVGENRGFAAGANIGIAHARGRYWLLLNPDVEVPPEGLITLLDWMDKHPAVGIASPELVESDGTWQSPGRPLPSVIRILLEMTRLHRLFRPGLRAAVFRGPYWVGGDQVNAGWVPGAAMMVRPLATRDVGLMREDFFMYGEDLEWCWRLRRAGWRVGVCSGTTFRHQTSSSATATFGETDTDRRVASGILRAWELMYGSAHARALAAATFLSLRLDAAGAGRTPEQRRAARSAAATWRRLAFRRGE